MMGRFLLGVAPCPGISCLSRVESDTPLKIENNRQRGRFSMEKIHS